MLVGEGRDAEEVTTDRLANLVMAVAGTSFRVEHREHDSVPGDQTPCLRFE